MAQNSNLSRRKTLAMLGVAVTGGASMTTGINAQAPPAGGPLASAATGPFSTQPWGQDARMSGTEFSVQRVTFNSQGLEVVGNLFVPSKPGRKPAIVVIGPVGFVKEQAPIQYASRLVRDGYVTLVFDPRYHGESQGEPRRLENGISKVEDLGAALDYVLTRDDVDPARLHLLGVCQGVNWAIAASIADTRVRSLGIVAGHYLIPEVAAMYLGGPEKAAARIAKGKAAEQKYKTTGHVDYINIVSPTLATPDPDALLTAPPIQMFYIRWADRTPFLAHRGLWENRIPAMSEATIWGHRIDEAMPRLKTPVMMVHADRAASGPQIPRKLFETIASADKELVWLGGQGQLQFYEDPLTIDQAVPHVARFFGRT